MNKFFRKAYGAVSDVAVVVGSAVGVGLISGKETQIFVGTYPNVLIFAVFFCAVLIIFREYCRKNDVATAADFAKKRFGRFASAFDFALCTCAFVCAVTCLAGVEQCLSEVLYLSNLPLYAVCVAFFAAVIMSKGMSALKVCNVISLLMTAALFIGLALNAVPQQTSVKPVPYMPVIYALFNFTMSLSLTCKLGSKSCKRQNVLFSVLSAAILAATVIITTLLADFGKPLPTLSNLTSPFLKCLAVLTVSLTSMCGLVGCALPVCELANTLIGDRTVSSMCVFGFACAFSMFGFDFLVRFGYVFVSALGAVVAVAAFASLLPKRSRSVPEAIARSRRHKPN